jgi:hypothetical protein
MTDILFHVLQAQSSAQVPWQHGKLLPWRWLLWHSSRDFLVSVRHDLEKTCHRQWGTVAAA